MSDINQEVETNVRNPPQRALRRTLYTFVLYPDCPSHVLLLESLRNGLLPYCAALHDKDNAKPHLHVVIKLRYAQSQHTVLTLLNERLSDGKLNDKGLQPVIDPGAMRSYLTHADPSSTNDGKYHYDDDIIEGDLSILAVHKPAMTDEQYSQLLIDVLGAIDIWVHADNVQSSFRGLASWLAAQGYAKAISRLGFLATRAMTEAVDERRSLLHAQAEGTALEYYRSVSHEQEIKIANLQGQLTALQTK